MVRVKIDNQQERLLAAYIAGFFDADGSASLFRVSNMKTGNWLRPELTITQKSPITLAYLSKTLTSLEIEHSCSSKKYNGVSRIMIAGQKRVKKFIEKIKPFAEAKRNELEILYGFIQKRQSAPPNTPYTEEDYALVEAMKKCKRTYEE